MNALIIVDMQKDFMPGGALAVPEGDTIVGIINRLMDSFDLTVASQDQHPPDHTSFAQNHPGKNVGDVIQLHGQDQIMWPVHCVRGTDGAAFVEGLATDKIHRLIEKGTDREIDSYSAFFDNDHKKATGLAGFLKEKGVTQVFLAGVATEYCVKFTALDAAELGFATHVVRDACRGVNLQPHDDEAALETMAGAGVEIITSDAILR